MGEAVRRPWGLGVALILLGVGFNLPYAVLADRFHYPDILRRPAGDVLALYAAAGPGLVLTWYAFALTALALVPVALAYGAQSGHRLARAASVMGVIAGLAQAVGLIRWALVVPVLARLEVDPASDPATRAAARVAFDVLNAYGGVAVGEHLGQIATAAWVGLVGWGLVRVPHARLSAGLALASAATLAVGTAEALVIALGAQPGAFGLVTVVGFGLITLWLMVEGVRLIAAPLAPRSVDPAARRRAVAPPGPAAPHPLDRNITPK